VSAVPAAIDALVAKFERRFTGTATIIDGPPTQNATGDLIAVGMAPEDVVGVESTEFISGLNSSSESFPVLCLARSWSGNASARDQRTRTYRLIDAVREELDADPSLGRAVTRARFAGSTYEPWRAENGVLVVDVRFTVAVDVL
jgi:hypothetical protein